MCGQEFIAIQYAQNAGYDSIRQAGTKDGFSYFHAFNRSNIGHKTGLPHIIKINVAGQLAVVKNLQERMWAVKEEIRIMQGEK